MTEKYIADKNIHDGHRQRMRAKFVSHGSDIFDTYELLEMLLYCVIPYKDTNPIAKRLLFAFGSLEGVFSASKEELMKINGVGERAAEYIKTAGNLPLMLACEAKLEKSYFSNYNSAGSFFVEHFKGEEGYKIAMLLLDNNMMPISVSDICDHDYQSAAVKPKPFITRALKEHASIAIIAHTHPHGPYVASEGDRVTNEIISSALSEVGVLLLEHYVVSGDRFDGFMIRLDRRFSQQYDIDGFLESKRTALLDNEQNSDGEVEL